MLLKKSFLPFTVTDRRKAQTLYQQAVFGDQLQDYPVKMEDSLYEEYLAPPEGEVTSAMVNSPTTDTLDSVALETSPTDEQDLVEDDLLSSDQTGKEGGGNSEKTEDPKDKGISFASPADISIDLNSSVIPSASTEAQNIFSTQREPEGDAPFDGTNPQPQTISSYFSTKETGDDFFDSLGGGEMSSDQKSSQENAFGDDSIDTNTTATNTAMPENQTSQADVFQPVSVDENKTENGGGMQRDVTHIYHREHKISQSEPETVAFEGTEEPSKETVAISDLTDKDEFESFTAGEGSNVIQHTGLIERSDSAPHGHGGAAVVGDQQGKVEELGAHVQGLTIQGPSVGTTPTQMSPVHQTPIAQPSSHKSGSEPPK